MRQKTTSQFRSKRCEFKRLPSLCCHKSFLADFTHEWPIEETHDRVRPFPHRKFRCSQHVDHRPRPAQGFEFGIGGGVKVFLKRRWGFRFQAEYLPMLMEAEGQNVVCAAGCIVVLNGGLMNQFAVTAGRFSDSERASIIESRCEGG